MSNFGLTFSDLILLGECELLSIQVLSLNPQVSEKKENFLSQDKYQNFISLKKGGKRILSYNVFRLSKSAAQLLDILSVEKNIEYFFEVLKEMTRINPDINIEVYEIISAGKTEIRFKQIEI